MLKVNCDGCITLTRGDTAHLIVTLTTETGQTYDMISGDELQFSVKQSVYDEGFVFQKISDTNEITIQSTDTSGLPFGDYVYDVQLVTAAGETYTVIQCTVFTVAKEVG